MMVEGSCHRPGQASRAPPMHDDRSDKATDYGSFLAEVGSVRVDKISWQHADTFNTFYDKLVAQTPESVNSKDRVQMMPSVVFGQQ